MCGIRLFSHWKLEILTNALSPVVKHENMCKVAGNGLKIDFPAGKMDKNNGFQWNFSFPLIFLRFSVRISIFPAENHKNLLIMRISINWWFFDLKKWGFWWKTRFEVLFSMVSGQKSENQSKNSRKQLFWSSMSLPRGRRDAYHLISDIKSTKVGAKSIWRHFWLGTSLFSFTFGLWSLSLSPTDSDKEGVYINTSGFIKDQVRSRMQQCFCVFCYATPFLSDKVIRDFEHF